MLLGVCVCRAEFNGDAMAAKMKKTIASSRFNSEDLGIYVADGGGGQKVFGLNETKMMLPASLSKIVTAGAALKYFSQGHKFETTLCIAKDAKIDRKNGVLKGSLYLHGGGDPSFVSEKMWFLVNEFIRQDIVEIQGDIVVDDSLFDKERFSEERQSKRVDRAYDAPVGAMSFNWNSVNVYVQPGLSTGAPAIVKIDPSTLMSSLATMQKLVRALVQRALPFLEYPLKRESAS